MHTTQRQLILVINSGSSSIKFQLLAMPGERALAGGILELSGATQGKFTRWFEPEPRNLARAESVTNATEHAQGFGHIENFIRTVLELIAPDETLSAIGHRVVHGGSQFSGSVVLDAMLLRQLDALRELAPLHNPANLAGIAYCFAAFAGVPQVAVFDTAFHSTLLPAAYRYAIPREWYEEYGIRKYGFHGISFSYVLAAAAQQLDQSIADTTIIALHLGNGASAAAIRNGRCIETSMGFTPLDGLVMGTRGGDLDPGIFLHLQRITKLEPCALETLLNRHAGLQGLCGASDMREVIENVQNNDPAAMLALEIYVRRIQHYIGAYLALLGPMDALVFTGGVGENSPQLRACVCASLGHLGLRLNAQLNAAPLASAGTLSSLDSPIKILAIRTNEELQIAREVLALAATPALDPA